VPVTASPHNPRPQHCPSRESMDRPGLPALVRRTTWARLLFARAVAPAMTNRYDIRTMLVRDRTTAPDTGRTIGARIRTKPRGKLWIRRLKSAWPPEAQKGDENSTHHALKTRTISVSGLDRRPRRRDHRGGGDTRTPTGRRHRPPPEARHVTRRNLLRSHLARKRKNAFVGAARRCERPDGVSGGSGTAVGPASLGPKTKGRQGDRGLDRLTPSPSRPIT